MNKIIDRHAGQTALIMACGPSLNVIPNEMFDKYPTLGLNRSYIKYVPDLYDRRRTGVIRRGAG